MCPLSYRFLLLEIVFVIIIGVWVEPQFGY